MQLPAFIKENFSKINKIVLARNIKKEAAQRLYTKCGFIDEDVRRIGKKVSLLL